METLAKHFKICYPTKNLKVTQKFGQNLVNFYKELGFDGHTGLDIKARTGTPLYAVADGEIKAYADRSGGIACELFTEIKEIEGKKVRFKIIYYHLLRNLVKTGDKVQKGQNIALSDNTGRYTTGPHLHFGLKPQYLIEKENRWVQDKSNGFAGAVDPIPFFDDNIDMLPVDRRYGETFNWTKEFLIRFKTPRVHRGLIRRGRSPLSLKNRELNALVYGGWSIEDILNPAIWITWTRRAKSFLGR